MATYRTDDGTRWGIGKGGPLTPTDVDLNFWELWHALTALQSGGADPAQISNISVVGSSMTVYLDDGRSFGPFALPVAMLRWRGEWAAATAYSELDLVRSAAYGTYLVLRAHTSAAAFEPNAANAEGQQLYHQLLPSAENREVLDLTVSQKTTHHLLALVDAHSFVRMNTAEDAYLTIPTDATTNFPIGTVVTVQQMGVGRTWIDAFDGVTVYTPEGSTPYYGYGLRKRYSTASIIKLGPNEWTIAGDLEVGA